MINGLHVRDLGVIASIAVTLDEGMTAITGETGAGKTLIVDALELLVGGRADPAMVRTGATETLVEGQFFAGGEEFVLSRTVPIEGRSRAVINGSFASLSALSELGTGLVDLYGQHDHQSLLSQQEQRRALDQFAEIDLEQVRELRSELREIERELVELGGDDQLRNRELDLLRYEFDEIERIGIVSSDEDELLAKEHDLLQNAVALREAVTESYEILVGDRSENVSDLLGVAIEAVNELDPLAHLAVRLRTLSSELSDVATELRQSIDSFESDPERLGEIRQRRAEFVRLIKKHGVSLADVVQAGEQLKARIKELESSDELRAQYRRDLELTEAKLMAAENAVGDARRLAAVPLAERVEAHLHELGLTGARLVIDLPDEGIADDVCFLFAANRGESALALSKVASGGELARAMLALRLVLSAGPSTLIFDEVDAGIGGEAAIAVGRALRELGRHHQVIVVTHLAQVAAFADNQLVVDKYEEEGRTLSRVSPVEGDLRVSELARMLSGHPESPSAKVHAAELLAEVRLNLRNVR